MKAVISIAARMTSKRLPGKVMQPVFRDMTLLEVVIERLRLSGLWVVVATTDADSDKPIADAAAMAEVPLILGSPDDLIARHAQVMAETDADVLLLAGADDPFLDWRQFTVLAHQLTMLHVPHPAYAKTEGWPLGMNAWGWTREAMEDALRLSTEQDEREHVIPFWERRPSMYPTYVMRRDVDIYDRHRLTIDEQADLDLARAIYAIAGRWDVPSSEVIEILQRYPSLAKMNEAGLQGYAARRAIYDLTPVDGSDVVAKLKRFVTTERAAAKAAVGEQGEFAQGRDMALLGVQQWLEMSER